MDFFALSYMTSIEDNFLYSPDYSSLHLIYLLLFFILCQRNSQVHVHWKGAAEIILGSCSGYLDANGVVQPISNDKVR